MKKTIFAAAFLMMLSYTSQAQNNATERKSPATPNSETRNPDGSVKISTGTQDNTQREKVQQAGDPAASPESRKNTTSTPDPRVNRQEQSPAGQPATLNAEPAGSQPAASPSDSRKNQQSAEPATAPRYEQGNAQGRPAEDKAQPADNKASAPAGEQR